jgi:phosphoserine phosphatase
MMIQGLESSVSRKRRGPRRCWLRLAVFDLDGTLKKAASPWRYLHEALGVDVKASSYRERFFAGQIDYLEWARLDAALWKGTEQARVETLFRGNPYRPGVPALFDLLQRNNVLTAIVSTGLDVHVRQVAEDLGIWRAVSNELVAHKGFLTGEVVVHVTERTKGEVMTWLREEAEALPQECLAVGDGPADTALFAQAGLAIAICPRDGSVGRAADFVIEDGDLCAIIPLLQQHFRLAQP